MCVRAQLLSHVQFFATPWTTARQAALSMGILPFPPPGDIPDPGIHRTPPSALAGGFFTTEPPGKQCLLHSKYVLLQTSIVTAVLVAQQCPTLCNPMDYNSPGSSVHGILQARILEWVVISSFSRGSSQPRVMNPFFLCLLHWQAGSLPLASPGKLKTLRHTGWPLWG